MARVDARFGDHDWQVWDCSSCAYVEHVLWADDVTHEYYQHIYPFRALPFNEGVAGRVVKAKKIVLLFHPKIVLIDPLEDAEQKPAVRYTNESSFQPT